MTTTPEYAENGKNWPGVSVVIPCHNAAATLTHQLDALAAQDYRGEWEIVIVDNLSTDNLAEVVDQYEGSLSGLRFVSAPDRANPGYARNVGLKHAKHDRILFCDADDVASPGWLSFMTKALENTPIATGPLEFSQLNRPHVAARVAQTSGLLNKFGFLPHGSTANAGVWRHVHETIAGFDEAMPALEDTDYFWRAQLAGFELAYAPEAVIHYRLRSDFTSILRQARQYAMGDVLLHKRYRSKGLAPLTFVSGLKGWVRLVLYLPRIISAAGRVRFAWKLGYRIGRLRGAVSYRVFAL